MTDERDLFECYTSGLSVFLGAFVIFIILDALVVAGRIVMQYYKGW